MPQKRRKLDPRKLNERFGLHFRGLIEAAGMSVGQIQECMVKAGHKISEQGIRNWTRGTAFPTPFAMEALASIFGLADYRLILPPPQKSRK
jgi:hypothetical protein